MYRHGKAKEMKEVVLMELIGREGALDLKLEQCGQETNSKGH